MNEHIAKIVARIHELEDELEAEIEKGRILYGLSIKEDVAQFKAEVVAKHRRLRKGLVQFFRESGFLNVLTMPVIYSLIVPMVLMDAWVTLYQQICFRAYGIPRVERSKYIVIDRHHLAYLNIIEKINCMYCGYGNGIIAYAREVASRTEQFWCPIKHALRIRDPHPRYRDFSDFGDAESFRAKLDEFRAKVKKPNQN